MRPWTWFLAALLAVALGCNGQESGSSLEPPRDAATAPTTATVVEKPSVETEAAPPATSAPAKPKPDPANVAKADPGLFGSYKMVLSQSQEKQLEEGLKELRELAAKGDPQATQALPMAEQISQATRNTTIILEKSGKYRANVANQAMTGVFTVNGNVVTFTPDEAVQGGPPATVMTFDPKAKTLSSETGEDTILFRRQ